MSDMMFEYSELRVRLMCDQFEYEYNYNSFQ